MLDAPGSIVTQAAGINDQGEVSGNTAAQGTNGTGFIRSASGQYTFFSPLPGISFGVVDLNNAGERILTGQTPYLRTANDEYLQLPPLVQRSVVSALNNSGEIAGWFYEGGVAAGFVLSLSTGI